MNFQKTTPSSKTPTQGHKSQEKQKKKTPDKSTGHEKSQVKKTGLLQRKLDSFTTSSNTKDNLIVSLSKMSDKSLKKFTPPKKDIVDICSSSEKDDDKTPSGQLRGTPVKCRLVLTPVKSPKVAGKSLTPKTSAANRDNKNKESVIIEDDMNDVVITGSKTSKSFLSQPGKKIRSSPKQDKSKKLLEGKDKSNIKSTKEAKTSKKLDLSKPIVTGTSMKAKKLTKGAESTKKNKSAKPDVSVEKGTLVNVDSDSDKDFASSPQKVNEKEVCSCMWKIS